VAALRVTGGRDGVVSWVDAPIHLLVSAELHRTGGAL
jgi:hypothetical protein